ncbi:glycoside hydrolase family 32 protein [Lederbergia wuyishanensis]|uniref:Sucrose-6-phosphate hydrolase n=1 Tax=Lederbergia wuyishanensis TaxID=1347903 RepID=A0ABU0D0F6_9BACI|nr:sucrose-6-phosphate hydrolase [Lederbergia wuyishanensis]MCJ8006497.1 sucrose-6-phosphate hydrolase [Lederbergia wuyishanensis]MDQ0341873.1 beta-fructofuranosidase [Lederbergia wuyishanensis]
MEKEIQLRNDIFQRIKQFQPKSPDNYRLAFHLTPPVGLMNDPNGLVYYKGKYHVFYQWNPFDTKHTFKCWGHYSSNDLIEWEEHPPALVPSEWYEKDGCYSGSAIEYDHKLFLFYTGNVKTEDGGRETYQCLAISEDGIHFEKKGPVIHLPDGYTPHFRDPKVWQHDNKWFMVIGAQTTSHDGTVVLFSSDDLEHWQLEGPLAGKGISLPNHFGYMWECPDFFSLNNTDILLVSPQGLKTEPFKYENLFQSGYFIGEWNMKSKSFVHDEFNELDHGFDFYAPQTFEDQTGRRILIAWMGMGDEQEQSHHSIKSGWVHALTIPREIFIQDGSLYQKPVEEMKQLRNKENSENITIANEHTKIPLISDLNEIMIEIEQFAGKQFEVQLQNNCKLIFNNEKGILTFERKSFDQLNLETRQCKIDNLQNLHMYLDRSSLEIFINDGQIVFTSRFYEEAVKNECVITVDGKTKFSLKNWSLHSYQIHNK